VLQWLNQGLSHNAVEGQASGAPTSHDHRPLLVTRYREPSLLIGNHRAINPAGGVEAEPLADDMAKVGGEFDALRKPSTEPYKHSIAGRRRSIV
jgi:hypothetical protein